MRRFIYFFLLLLTTTTSYGQISKILSDVYKYEIALGMMSTTFSGNDWQNNRIKISYSAGIGMSWDFNQSLSMNFKILAERKGIKFSSEPYYFDEDMQQLKGEHTSRTNLDYLSFPILIEYRLNEIPGKGFLIEIGPYLSYLYKAQAIAEYSWMEKKVYNRIDDFDAIDLGFSLQAGYQFKVRDNSSIKLWFNFTKGLNKIGKESGATGFLDAKNQSLGIGVSFIHFR